MREIKFRAKNKDGNWAYGELLRSEHDFVKGYDIITPEWGQVKTVNEKTIGQYTGFKDINGVEIYEGDVLKSAFNENPFGVVTWHEWGGYFFIDTSVIPINWNSSYRPLGEMIDLKIDDKPISLEVIGNIYDNPTLFPKK